MRAAERAGRMSVTERDVTSALDEAATLGKQAATLTNDPVHWEATLMEALSAVKRADGLLNSGEATDELRGRTAALRQDLEAADKDRRMIARLEAARLQSAAAGKEGIFDAAGSATLYASAFEDDMRLRSLSADQAAEAINKRAIREDLLAYLAEWTNITTSKKDRQWLRGILRAAEPDLTTFRNRWNAALAQNDGDGLRHLAFGQEAGNQPAVMVVLMGRQLTQVNAEDAVKFLKATNERHPGDFWTLSELGYACLESKPPRMDEAARYSTAALALRPDSSGTHNNLGKALRDLGKMDEAAAEYRRAIQLDPKLAYAHNGLGNVLGDQGKREEAAAEYRTAIQLDPKNAIDHNNLGKLLDDQGSARRRPPSTAPPPNSTLSSPMLTTASATSWATRASAKRRPPNTALPSNSILRTPLPTITSVNS